ncbi:MAG: hypothetical protein CM15mV68_320 [uncultured marine virus]|nr:MAG: hypothetical protein CM15mV68_320 [uncultured marine virus]
MIEGFGLHKYYQNIKTQGTTAFAHNAAHKFDSSGYTMVHRGFGNASSYATYFVAFAEMPYKFARSG